MEIKNTERSFHFNELFFSRTNSRGIIQSGNSVFQRISVYEWPELINKPHSRVRHPDSPRGVFYLLWDTIKQNKPIGAYVKNLSENGEYYWVYALVLPHPSGDYISLRLKPSSEYFPIIQKLYQQLTKAENTQNVSPKQSSENLIKEINNLGFPDYFSFMTEVLISELESRQKKLGLPAIQMIDLLRKMIKHGRIYDR